MKSFQDKVVVITGAGSGIGRALAYDFAKRGAKLALNDWDEVSLLETATQIKNKGGVVFFKNFDVAIKEEVHAFAEVVAQHYGQVDVLVNNAGLTLQNKTFEDTSYEEFEKVIGVNMWGMIYGCKAFLPYLKARPEAILANVSSIFGLVGFPTQSFYSTSKFAIKGLTDTLRVELLKTNVQVAVIMPGGIKTNIVNNSTFRNDAERKKAAKTFERLARTTAEDAAAVIIKGFQRKKPRILIGSDAKRMAFMVKYFKNRFDEILYENLMKLKKNNTIK